MSYESIDMAWAWSQGFTAGLVYKDGPGEVKDINPYMCKFPPGCVEGVQEGKQLCPAHFDALSALFAPA